MRVIVQLLPNTKKLQFKILGVTFKTAIIDKPITGILCYFWDNFRTVQPSSRSHRAVIYVSTWISAFQFEIRTTVSPE